MLFKIIQTDNNKDNEWHNERSKEEKENIGSRLSHANQTFTYRFHALAHTYTQTERERERALVIRQGSKLLMTTRKLDNG